MSSNSNSNTVTDVTTVTDVLEVSEVREVKQGKRKVNEEEMEAKKKKKEAAMEVKRKKKEEENEERDMLKYNIKFAKGSYQAMKKLYDNVWGRDHMGNVRHDADLTKKYDIWMDACKKYDEFLERKRK